MLRSFRLFSKISFQILGGRWHHKAEIGEKTSTVFSGKDNCETIQKFVVEKQCENFNKFPAENFL